jgi:hypothetical protein
MRLLRSRGDQEQASRFARVPLEERRERRVEQPVDSSVQSDRTVQMDITEALLVAPDEFLAQNSAVNCRKTATASTKSQEHALGAG